MRWWESFRPRGYIGERGGEEGGEQRTLEFIFAHVDGGWGVHYVGGEVVDHCFKVFGVVLWEKEGGVGRYRRVVVFGRVLLSKA